MYSNVQVTMKMQNYRHFPVCSKVDTLLQTGKSTILNLIGMQSLIIPTSLC